MAKSKKVQQVQRVTALVRQASNGLGSSSYGDLVDQARRSETHHDLRRLTRPRWYEFWAMWRKPCKSVYCHADHHSSNIGESWGVFACVATGFFFLGLCLGPWPVPLLSRLFYGGVFFLGLRLSWYLYLSAEWREHKQDIEEARSKLLAIRGADHVRACLVKDIIFVRDCILGKETELMQARTFLSAKLEKNRKRAAALEQSAKRAQHPEMKAALTTAHSESVASVAQRVQNLALIEMHITRLTAFFDQLNADCAAIPFSELALLEEHNEDQVSLGKEIALAEQVVASSVAQLEARMVRLESALTSQLPQAVARLTAASDMHLDQELQLLDSTIGQAVTFALSSGKSSQSAEV